MAIRLHYKEVYGLLLELGFHVPESKFTSMLAPIEAGHIDCVEFLGLNPANNIELALSMHIDWAKHMLIVQSGNSVRLPIRNGVVYLQQVRAVAEEFMKVFRDRRLTGEFRTFYRADLSKVECERLNNSYGFTGKPTEFAWDNERDPLSFTSRYHPGVSFRIQVARPS
jgi:hypothetical protein